MTNIIEIHPNTLFSHIKLEDLGYDVETVCEIAQVDQDVFDSHHSYTSALYVANDIANDVNKQIHKEFFSGSKSLIDDERYELTADGEYTLKYKFTNQFTKFTGVDIMALFGIRGQAYFTQQDNGELTDYENAIDLYEREEYDMLVDIYGPAEAYRIINS